MAARPSKTKRGPREPTIENRRARKTFLIEDSIECGIKLTGTEIKSIRDSKVSIAEGFARATDHPAVTLLLYGVHIAEYPPAGSHRQHEPNRVRTLLAQKREIRKLADRTRQAGTTLIPLKLYFVRGKAKILLGIAQGRRKADKRQKMDEKQARRDIDRAMSKKM
jgi:SsrA-binding protein